MHAGFRYLLDMNTLLLDWNSENSSNTAGRCLSRTINVDVCERTKTNDSIKNYCDAVALTDNFVFMRWLIGVREQVRILILTIKFYTQKIMLIVLMAQQLR